MAYSFVPQNVPVRNEYATAYTIKVEGGTTTYLRPAVSLESLQAVAAALGSDFYAENVPFAGFPIRQTWAYNSGAFTIADDDEIVIPVLRNSRYPDLGFVFGSNNVADDKIPENVYVTVYNITEKQRLNSYALSAGNRDITHFSCYSINENLAFLYPVDDNNAYTNYPLVFFEKCFVHYNYENNGINTNNYNLVYTLANGERYTDAYTFNTSVRYLMVPLYAEHVDIEYGEDDAGFAGVYILERGTSGTLRSVTKDGKTYLIVSSNTTAYDRYALIEFAISQDALGS